MSAGPWVFVTSFVGIQVAWYWFQQNYVPGKEQHPHPVIRLINFVKKPKSEDE